jgi:hypothetical protein
MLAALEEGNWLSRQDLFRHAGTFYLTNNAASELRALGYNVEQRRREGKYEYRVSAVGPCQGLDEPRMAPPSPALADVDTLSFASPTAVQLTLVA